VLFSRQEVADFVNRSFEPVWESVRPVPLVRIDFGNGTVINRTLHGNIATYVCNADGQVLDILPCIYTPRVYVNRLNQLRLLASYAEQAGKDQREARLKDYHQRLLDALSKNEAPPVFRANPAGMTKARIESSATVLVAGSRVQVKPAAAAVKPDPDPKLASTEDLASWKELAEDTRQNETVRRRQVHAMLAARGMVKPEAITKRLYKEVLHSDLDDPYLGLGKTLFANYPFSEDKVH